MSFADYNQHGGGQEFSYGSGGGGNKSSGGGWMNSSTGGGDEDNKTRGGYKNQTLRPVTIKQLIEVPAPSADSPISIDGAEVKNVTFVGVVRSVLQQPINSIYSIEDGTGKIDARVWTGGNDNGGGDMGDDDQGSASNQMADPNITVGKYVRVYGELRFFNGKRSVTTHKVRLVTDHNEITYHGLEAIYVHLTKTRGQAPALRQGGAQAGVGLGSGLGNSSLYSSSGAMGGYGGMSGGNQGLNPVQAAVLDVIKDFSTQSEGLAINVIQQRLAGRYNGAQVTSTVDWLISEGHLYNTIDDNHVQSTSMGG
ncbi:Replication factor A protein 2 [Coemansia sp. BCRC 34301]|nr:Replication factor A protein 2 [Coemansia sp. BCRC 34301]